MTVAQWIAELARTLVDSGDVVVLVKDDDNRNYSYSFEIDDMLYPRTLVINVNPPKESGI